MIELYHYYLPFLRWCAWRVSRQYPWLKDDIEQEAHLMFWRVLRLCRRDKLNREYIKKTVGYGLWRKTARQCKREARIFYDYVTEAAPPQSDPYTKALTFEILSARTLSTLQKQIIYRHFIVDETTAEIGEALGLPAAKVKSQLQVAQNRIADEFGIERDRHRKSNDHYGPDDFRVWRPRIPADHRTKKKSWKVRARRGARGQEFSKYFSELAEAERFFKRAQIEHEAAFAKGS